MALYNYGNDPANTWQSQNTISVGGQTEAAIMWRGSFNALFGGDVRALADISSGSFFGGIRASFVGGIQAQIRTSTTNSNKTVIAEITPDIEYTVFALLTGGSLKIYLNGVVVIDELRDGGLMSITDNFSVSGFTTDGVDQVHNAAAYWIGSVPSEANIQAYPTLELADFDTPPTDGYIYQGDGGIVSSVPNIAGGNPLVQSTGATTGENAPTMDGAVPSTDSVTLTEIDGRTAAQNDVYGVKAIIAGAQSPAVSVSGTYTGTAAPEGIRIRTTGSAYRNVQNLVVDEIEKTWSGTIILAIGDGVEYGDINSQDTTVMPNICCGRVFYALGQSNATGKFGTDPGQTLPAELPAGGIIYKSNSAGVFTKNPAPGVDYHWTYALSLLSRRIGEPIIYINEAIGATDVQSWQSGGSSYTTAVANLTAAGLLDTATGANVIWWQGEQDTGMAEATYRDHLLQVKSDWVAIAGTDQWFITPIINRNSVCRGTLDAISVDSDMHLGSMNFDILNGLDNIHPTDPQEAQIIGARVSQSLLSYYEGRYQFGLQLSDITLSSTLNLSITGAPDGTYETVLTSGGNTVFSGPVTYASQSASVVVPKLATSSVTGHIVSGNSGAVVVGVTE